MKITYVMGVYKTDVVYRSADGAEHSRSISTRSNSEQTAEAMALGKVLKENGQKEYIRLLAVNTVVVKEAIND